MVRRLAIGLLLLGGCASEGTGSGSLRIDIVGDSSFDHSRVARLILRVDGDGPTVERPVVLPGSMLGAGVTDGYSPSGTGMILVVSAVGYDSAGMPVASGIAEPLQVAVGVNDVRVTMSTAGSVPDGGAAVADLAGADFAGQVVDLTMGPAPDLALPCNDVNCPLGCNQQLMRCNRPLPVNYGQLPMMGMFQSAVIIDQNIGLDTATGIAYDANSMPVKVGLTFSVQQGTQPNGAPRLAVFGAKSLKINKGVGIRLFDSANGSPGNAALFFIEGDIQIDGWIEAGGMGLNFLPGVGRGPGPGGYPGSNSDGAGRGPGGCGGTSGSSSLLGDDGGGGGGASGGRGGDGAQRGLAGAGKGGTMVILQPVPLQGGCGGGTGSNSVNGAMRAEGGGGGGALQLSAGGKLTLSVGAAIDVAGNGGAGGTAPASGGGGGAGGMVIFEAATIEVQAGSLVAANGGGGGAGGNGNGQAAGGAGQPGQVAIVKATGGASNSPGGGGGWQNAVGGENAPGAGSMNGGAGGAGVGLFFSIGGQVTVAGSTRSAVYVPLKVMKVY